ncbi:MAG TPA: ribosome biogenesis factor YjgA [Dongiaceae bacterium]|nr:ribosome biogenesis factor YjgA [Dongiaceae bacterium]
MAFPGSDKRETTYAEQPGIAATLQGMATANPVPLWYHGRPFPQPIQLQRPFMIDYNDTDDDQDLPPSKGALKRETEHMQKIGEKLLYLSDAQLAKLPLTDKLIAALEEGKRIKSNTEALRRHKQYIGKIIREADVATIEARVTEFENSHSLNTRQFHKLELLRDELINGDNAEIGKVIAQFPDVDSPKLRQLVRNAKKERDQNLAHPEKPENTHGRKLFRYLRELSQL